MKLRLGRNRTRFLTAALIVSASSASQADVGWDRIANVESAATQIGQIQAQAGIEQAFKFISACYKTHGLATAYSKAFEGCIAQDYIVSRALVQIYERVPPEALAKMNAPSPQQIDQSFQNRAAAAFAQYKRPPEDALALRGVVEARGVPVFFKLVFPDKQPSSEPSKKQ
jgi:hypothetical protein